MNNISQIVLIQNNEFSDYYYNVIFEDQILCTICYFKKTGWMALEFNNDWSLSSDFLYEVADKINELNAATKADKLFGFL